MKKFIGSVLALFLAWTASAGTTANNDSCDIAVLPAATLLLPYFEVDLDDPAATTLFTITNVTNTDAIARVTLWTDRGYPVFTFNVQLTGYDVHPLNLYDVLARGMIPPSTETRGRFSDPNPEIDACDGPAGALDPAVVARLRSAFTTGAIAGECNHAGGFHEKAVGYATIDVVGNCSTNTPKDRAYWSTDLRHDNILLGDYQQLDGERAQGGPLVHIRVTPERAVPEGGRTFYARYTDDDRRQPLPSQFAARWSEGTSLKIWREGRTGRESSCADYAADENLAVADVVAFDDQENAAEGRRVRLGAASKTAIDDPLLPRLENGASNGWIYLNLDRSRRDDFASQAWVISSSTDSDVDAVALANGCAAPAEAGAKIAPALEEDSCDIALLPAATLLLPYFEVDLDDGQSERTVFTVTNVSPQDRIARVTLWTDYAYPVLTFNVYLTGYDVQTIDLYDVIKEGIVGPTGTQVTDRGPRSDRNFGLDLDACGQTGGRVLPDWLARMQLAFTEGVLPLSECNNVGNEHERAIGYATVDVVRNCRERSPLDAEYWTEDLAWDNVLIGDYRQVQRGPTESTTLVQSSSLVHIRALAEGAGLPRTFYGRYTPAGAPRLDRRQPLPTVFAARWIQGGPGSFETDLKIWREGPVGRDGTCATWDGNAQEWPEVVTFDENENARGTTPSRPPGPTLIVYSLPAAVRMSVAHDPGTIAHPDNGAFAGWVYINLDDDEIPDGRPMQAWVISSMRAAGRYTVDAEAAAFGNGCSAEPPPYTEATNGTALIGPLP